LLHSRIGAIQYGAADPRLGALDTHSYRHELERTYGYFPKAYAGIMMGECSGLLTSFFKELRKKKHENHLDTQP
jgi:tRNA(adenine34) deaminase